MATFVYPGDCGTLEKASRALGYRGHTPRSLRPSLTACAADCPASVRFDLTKPPGDTSGWKAQVQDMCGAACLEYPVHHVNGCEVHVRLDGKLGELAPNVYRIVLIDDDCQDCALIHLSTLKGAESTNPAQVTNAVFTEGPETPEGVGTMYDEFLGYQTTTVTVTSQGATMICVAAVPDCDPICFPVDLLICDGLSEEIITVTGITAGDNPKLTLSTPIRQKQNYPIGSPVKFRWTTDNVTRAVASAAP